MVKKAPAKKKKRVKTIKITEEVPPIPEKLFPGLIWFASYHTKKFMLVFILIGIIVWVLTTVSFSFYKGRDGKLHIKKVNVERVQLKGSLNKK